MGACAPVLRGSPNRSSPTEILSETDEFESKLRSGACKNDGVGFVDEFEAPRRVFYRPRLIIGRDAHGGDERWGREGVLYLCQVGSILLGCVRVITAVALTEF